MPRATGTTRTAAKEQTRTALIAAALAEFAERGLDTPSLDSICARAGFTRGAFYVHFDSRDDLLEAVMETVLGAFLDAVIASGDGAHDLEDTIHRFAAAVTVPVGASARLPAMAIDFHRVLDACARSPRLRRRFVALVQSGATRVADATKRGQAAGTVRDDVDAHVLGQLLALLALGVVTGIGTGVALDTDRAQTAVLSLLGRAATGNVGGPRTVRRTGGKSNPTTPQ